jgi:hypothetical protein
MLPEQIQHSWLQSIDKIRPELEKEVEQYDANPVGMRNLCAEMGVELTPTELNDLVNLVKDTL